MRAALVLTTILALALAMSVSAFAQADGPRAPAPATTPLVPVQPKPAAARKPVTPPPDPVPTLPAPSIALKLVPGSQGGPWRISIENSGEGPIRIAADPRLLILELTPPVTEPDPADKKKKPAAAAPPRCVLPDDTRPTTDDGHDLVIPPKRAWSTSFDPLFYCFGAKERAALVTGTSVRARFGWPLPTPKPNAKPVIPNPPFAATPVGASVGKVSTLKSIDADPIVLTEAVTAKPATTDADTSSATNTVTLSIPEAMDTGRGVELGTTVTLTNGSDRAITLMYRPELLLFTVSGPAGNVNCGLPRQSTPIRELFQTVAVKGRLDTGVLFSTTCPVGTFDEPGIYRVLPRIDTSGSSGRSIGLKTWDGQAAAKTPMLLRVRNPKTNALPPRPTLD